MINPWWLFGLYALGTLVLALWGSRRTASLKEFAVGAGDLHPVIVGLALAASMASTATFVINPGIVYAYGLSAVLGYGVAAGIGLVVGIIVLSKGFRRMDHGGTALTVPHWVGQRYKAPYLTTFFAVVSLALVAMVVLISYSMAGLLVTTLSLPDGLVAPFGGAFEFALALIIVFVFSYVFFGGTYAHAFTNAFQGGAMMVVAVVLLASGWEWLGPGFFDRLRAVDPTYGGIVRPDSLLFRNLFEVFGANLLVGFALACQPHFLIKAAYVKTEAAVNRYLAVAVTVGLLFNLVLLCGLFARLEGASPEGAAFNEALQKAGMGIDGVMPAYIASHFSPLMATLIAVALLAAGMSTLDGILVALSAIFANDLVLPVWRRLRRLRRGPTEGDGAGDREAETDTNMALWVSRGGLVALGVAAWLLALEQHRDKDLSVAIFAQEGVYALFCASFVPLLFGIFSRRSLALHPRVVLLAACVALAVHFGFRYGKWTLLTAADYTNPGLTATYGLLASLVVAGVALLAGLAGTRGRTRKGEGS